MSDIHGGIERVLSAPIMHIDAVGPLNSHSCKRNIIVEAVNAEKQLWRLIHSKGILHTNARELYRDARSSYEKAILNDHELADLNNVEFSLWKLHYKHIDEYRNRIRDSSDNKEHTSLGIGQYNNDNLLEGFKSFLSEATEFYLDLIPKIRRNYGLPEELIFFNEGGFTSSLDSTKIRRCQFSCHRCLVCLGDLARYRELYGNLDPQNRNWSLAAAHYLNASMIWPDSGNPQNQLAVLATYVGDEFLALYHCIRSLAVKEPFPDAWDNLILLFEKNRLSHLHSLSNEATFDFFEPSERSPLQIKAQASDNFTNCHAREASEDAFPENSGLWSLIVRMISFFYIKSSLEDFPYIFGSTVRELEAILSLDDARLKVALESYQHMDSSRTGPFRVLQLVSIFIFTIHILSESSKLQKPKHLKYMQKPALIQQALASTFICMGRLVNRCVMANSVDCNPLLPAILVFVEWLVDIVDREEIYASDEKCMKAMDYFFGVFVDLLNRFDDRWGETESPNFIALWEDNELWGFSPIVKFHGPLDCITHRELRNDFEDTHECQVRICRIHLAAMKMVNRSNGSRKWIFYEQIGGKFSTENSKIMLSGRELEAAAHVLPFYETTEESEMQVNEANQDKIVEHISSTPVEEEEVILFKPITRYNSAPPHIPFETTCQEARYGECLRRGSSLPQNQINVIDSSCNKTFWQEPIPEDSVMDSFIAQLTDSPRFGTGDARTEGLPSLAGPPSLNAWVLNRENIDIGLEKGSNKISKYGLGKAGDIASGYLSGLSIDETSIGQQDVNITSAPPTSHVMYDFLSEGVSITGPWHSSAATHLLEPPYLPPVPSAPLLPDDATWCTTDSTNYAECKEDVKEHIPNASQVNSYSNVSGTQGGPILGPSIPRLISGHTPIPDTTHSAQWLHQYQENPNLDPAHGHIMPIHYYSPTNLGWFLDHDVSRLVPPDRWTNPIASKPTKYLESQDPSLHPGFCMVYGANEQMREKPFRGYQRPSPYGYGDPTELISEQQLLLQYLKEKEWSLQREPQLRGPN